VIAREEALLYIFMREEVCASVREEAHVYDCEKEVRV
jgi:hypothetical protein